MRIFVALLACEDFARIPAQPRDDASVLRVHSASGMQLSGQHLYEASISEQARTAGIGYSRQSCVQPASNRTCVWNLTERRSNRYVSVLIRSYPPLKDQGTPNVVLEIIA